MFKQTFATVAAAGVLMLGMAAPSFAGDQDFTIVNKTGMTFNEIYVEASSNKDSWGEDVLGEEALINGEEFTVEFDGYGKECKFDVMLVDTKGTKWTVEKLDLCKVSTFTLTKKGNSLAWAAK